MPFNFQVGQRLPELVRQIVDSYESRQRTCYLDKASLPNRAATIEIVKLLLGLAYPGYHGRQGLTRHNVEYHVGELVPCIGQKLDQEIDHALSYQQEAGDTPQDQPKSREITLQFLERISAIREQLAGDVQAAYDGDPAAVNTDEVILAYPGLLAITVYRFAHELHRMGVPLIPRMMTEWAHTVTGADIHPGADIGRNFFIDHATGVVIGETTEIGDNVKLYQGVTLGALSFPKDERGRLIRGHKRHPTVQDGVTIYANATVLGGRTVIGESAVIGGSVFLTRSVPPHAVVSLKPPELRVLQRGEADYQWDPSALDSAL
jgi:serine O-acetyltransferase